MNTELGKLKQVGNKVREDMQKGNFDWTVLCFGSTLLWHSLYKHSPKENRGTSSDFNAQMIYVETYQIDVGEEE